MANAALLIIDVQNGIVERYPDAAAPLLTALATAAAAARSAGVPVIFVRVAFRPGSPEISVRNRTFSAVAAAGGMGDDDPATQIHPAVTPQPNDILVTKKRVSAFAGSDLDVVLRSLNVDSLVLAGIATSGVVLSTLRQAADLDFELTVLRDGCADADSEVHRVLLEKVFPRQATVTDVEAWVKSLQSGLPSQ
jgi:nicotinamidase-related amidase